MPAGYSIYCQGRPSIYILWKLLVPTSFNSLFFLDTSRKPSPGEKCGVSWFFEPEKSMLGDIGKHEYLEYGKHEGAIYGTKLSTIKNIIKCGKTPVIDPEIPVRYR